MILVDTSVWIDHLRTSDHSLVALLDEVSVCVHPMIIGELALGSLRNRAVVLGLLAELPAVPVATDPEVLELVGARSLYGTGLSYVDAHLLAAVLLADDTRLWTRDRRLREAAQQLGAAIDLAT